MKTIKDEGSRARERVELAKCLPRKHEDQGIQPRIYVFKKVQRLRTWLSG